MDKQVSTINSAINTTPPSPAPLSDNSVGDTLLGRALDILAVQLHKLRELTEVSRHLGDDASRERQSLHQFQDEINYRLRFLAESLKIDESEDEAVRLRRQGLLERLEFFERRDSELNALVSDLDDANKRLNMLIRQLELAGSDLARTRTPHGAITSNPLQIALRAQMIEGQEEERSRMARELHDGPAQVMAHAVMQLEFCSQLIQKDKPQAQQELENLRYSMRDSLSELRRFMFNLRPTSLTEQGLDVTLQKYAADFANQYSLQIEVQLPDLQHILAADQELTVFRVVQEALQNVRKHSGAGRIEIYGSLMPDGKVQFSIKDDGHGFETKKLAPNLVSGAGIPGMRERAEIAGGKLNIKSKLGYGTEVVLILWPHGVK